MPTHEARLRGLVLGCADRAARPRSRGVTATVLATLLGLLLPGGLAHSEEDTALNYPETKRLDVSEEHFGVRIADPYRWLENDIRQDPDVALWADAQNTLAMRYLSELPGRTIFHDRLTALFDHERLTTPLKRGDRYFFTRNSGLDNQSVLVMREGRDGNDRIVLDPNDWSEDGTTALAEWAPSKDGTHIAFAIQEAGADWRTIRVLDVDSGAVLDDAISWARFTTIAWASDGSGFFYARNPEPAENAPFETLILGHSIYFHRLGTPQSEDRLVHAPESAYPLIHTVDVTPDGRYAIIYSTALTGGNAVSLIDLDEPDWTVRPIIEAFENPATIAGNIGSKFFLVTQEGAERGKVATFDLADSDLTFTDVVPERPDEILRLATLVGDRLIVSWMVDAKTEVERFRLDGTPDGRVALPGIGSAGSFHGQPGDDEAFFVFTGHDIPTSIYRYDVATDRMTPWAKPEVALDLDRIVVEQKFYASKDGTRVPIFVVRRDDVQGPAPTMLYAYGGFGIPMVPFYSPAAMAWVEQGGVYVTASIRGGSEYGKAWHDGGRRRNKQNVFDDFIAAGEFLKSEGITSADGLAIHGESNGGLLVAAVVNQRPDLFAAALPGVAVTDMLRFDRFTGGKLWTQEFGDPTVEADFQTLRSYSPLHNVTEGVEYPPILVTTADTDDRVVPGHSFKYAATLQAADIGEKPHLLRVAMRTGHGAGKPTDMVIDEIADLWAFAAHWTGLNVEIIE